MMGDLTVSEKRLIAALDRIDYSIERAAAQLRTGVAAPDPVPDEAPGVEGASAAELEAALGENARLASELQAAIEARETLARRIGALNERLAAQGQEAARLSAANEALAGANRQLLSRADSGGPGPDEVRAALEAEVQALRAARAAEIAQVDEVLDMLDEMLGEGPKTARPLRAQQSAAAPQDELIEVTEIIAQEETVRRDEEQQAEPEAAIDGERG